jgi:hypothetical protein
VKLVEKKVCYGRDPQNTRLLAVQAGRYWLPRPKILAPAVGSCEGILHRSQIELKEENFEIPKFSWGG